MGIDRSTASVYMHLIQTGSNLYVHVHLFTQFNKENGGNAFMSSTSSRKDYTSSQTVYFRTEELLVNVRDVPDMRFRFRFWPSCSQKPDI